MGTPRQPPFHYRSHWAIYKEPVKADVAFLFFSHDIVEFSGLPEVFCLILSDIRISLR
jgi:hypothetical protein